MMIWIEELVVDPKFKNCLGYYGHLVNDFKVDSIDDALVVVKDCLERKSNVQINWIHEYQLEFNI